MQQEQIAGEKDECIKRLAIWPSHNGSILLVTTYLLLQNGSSGKVECSLNFRTNTSQKHFYVAWESVCPFFWGALTPHTLKQVHYSEIKSASVGKFTFSLLLKGRVELHKNILEVLGLQSAAQRHFSKANACQHGLTSCHPMEDQATQLHHMIYKGSILFPVNL